MSSVGAAAEFLRDKFGDFGPAGSPALVVADGEPGDQATAATGAERGQQIGESIGNVGGCPGPVLGGGWRNACPVGIGARKITEIATHCTALPTDVVVALPRRGGVGIDFHMFYVDDSRFRRLDCLQQGRSVVDRYMGEELT
jgi:hypothetical protein